MLSARILVGAILFILTLGILIADVYLAPFYPFLLVFILGLGVVTVHEFIDLLGPTRPVQVPIAYAGVLGLALGNWVVHFVHPTPPQWSALGGILTGFVLFVFLYEMARYTDPGLSVERMGRTWLILGYLGWLPCFLVQLRWLYPVDPSAHNDGSEAQVRCSMALALALFVPKSCDIGAFFTGRLFGRHPMAPILSPKKTLEGAAGGMVTAACVTVVFDRLGPAPVLHANLAVEIGFGLTVALAGMLGDLAESLLKRDCHKKDAARTLPGFGGVLDVVDAVVFAAPVAYTWLALASLYER